MHLRTINEEEFTFLKLRYQIVYDYATGDVEVDGEHHGRELKEGEKMPFYISIWATPDPRGPFFEVKISQVDMFSSLHFIYDEEELSEKFFKYKDKCYFFHGAQILSVHIGHNDAAQ